ncbi:hypothetical protein DRQ09_07880 [candidate division KSB1 bacterium]|nr:MAG: hypothetical protein DRQ09_07880 [candidate division KSB1 bacterium]
MDEEELKRKIRELERRLREKEKEVENLKKVEKKYRIQNEELNAIINTIPHHLSFLSPDLRYVWVNKGAARLTDIPEKELIGRHCYEVYHQRKEPCENCPTLKTIKTGKPHQGPRITPDGRHWDLFAYPVSSEEGEIIGAVELAIDVTERKKMMDLIKAEKDKLEKIIKTMGNDLEIINQDFIIEFQNDLLKEKYGDATGKICYKYYRNREKPCDVCPSRDAIKNNRTEKAEIIASDNRYYEIIATPFVDIDGKVKAIEISRDITERKKLEKDLTSSEKKYRNLINATPVGIYQTTIDGKIIFCNDSLVHMLGYDSAEELMKVPVINLYANREDRKNLLETLKHQDSVENYEILSVKKNGETFWISFSANLIREKGIIQGIVIDITKRKELEEEIRKRRRELGAMNIISASVTKRKLKLKELYNQIGDELSRIIKADTYYLCLLSKEKGKIDCKYIREKGEKKRCKTINFTGGILEWLVKNKKSVFTNNLPKLRKEKGLRRIPVLKDEKASLSWIGVPIIIDNEAVGAIVVASHKYNAFTVNDLSFILNIANQASIAIKNERLTRELKESEKRFRKVIEQSRDGIFIGDIEGNVILYNKAMKEITGYTSKEVNRYGWFNLVYPDEKVRKEAIERARSVHQEKLKYYEAEIICKNGTKKNISFSVTPFKIEKEIYNLGIMTDITEYKRLQEQLFFSQKMESIGRLAGGIAHDFNNILTGIMGYSELLMQKYGPEHPDHFALDVIFKGTERAATLTQQLLGFARGGKYNPVPLDMNDSILNTLKIVEKSFEKNIDLKLDLSQDLKLVEADRTQMEQVISNILINAKDAMPSGGEIHIKTQNIFLPEDYCRVFPELEPGFYVKTSITDTGIGMPKEIKDKIFEPFFTTKGKGRGTGLGLSTVYGIIKNHRGQINVYSEPGEGSTFNIYLPVTEKEISFVEKEEKIFKGKGTILVVDDEKHIRDLTREMLTSLGYDVFLAENGVEAINLYKKNKDKINLILLDIVMPEKAGKDTFIELKKINPEIRIIIVSGYSQNGKAAEIIELGANGFLQKPFKIEEISKIIRNNLRIKNQD